MDQNIVQFAMVKPEAMVTRARVNDHGCVRGAHACFSHLFQTDGTSAQGLLGVILFSKCLEQGRGLIRIAQQQLQFTGIQPDTPAGHAVVDFHIVEFQSNHGITAHRAVHRSILKGFITEPCTQAPEFTCLIHKTH